VKALRIPDFPGLPRLLSQVFWKGRSVWIEPLPTPQGPAVYSVDPGSEAHGIDRATHWGKAVVAESGTDRLYLVLEGLVDGAEVAGELRRRVVVTPQPAGVLAPGRLRLEYVDEGEAEPSGQRLHHLVASVDELSTPLRALAVEPGAGVRVHPATETVLGLVDGGDDAGIVEFEGGC
jgi:hypothetical protein